MYALIDCNNFFVSAERAFDPSLDGRPVAVLSNNDGNVISRSNELKAIGVEMGMPFVHLQPLIKRHNIAVRSSNFALYGDVSRRVMATLAEFAPEVEPYSIDEAFIQINLLSGQDYAEYGKAIRACIGQWTGIPVGVGFAPTKTLAKIANHIGKKRADGVFVMPADPGPIIDHMEIEDVWGIGSRFGAKLRKLGIHTVGQFRAVEESFLRKQFNVCAARIHLELRGIPALEAEDMEAPRQSISCSRSFGRPVTEFQELCEAVASYTALACEKLRSGKQRVTVANVYFQLKPDVNRGEYHGNICGKSIAFSRPLSATIDILQEIMPSLPLIFIAGKRYKKAGIILSGLVDARQEQMDLFATPLDGKDELYAAIDKINRTLGRKAVFHLSEGLERPWLMKREHLSPNYTTNWEDIPVAK